MSLVIEDAVVTEVPSSVSRLSIRTFVEFSILQTIQR